MTYGDLTLAGTTVGYSAPVGRTNPVPVALVPDSGGTTLVDNTTAANASCVATLATGAAETAYLTKVIIGGLGATVAATPLCTIAGAIGDDIVFPVNVPAGALLPMAPIVLDFNPPLPAAIGDDISVTVGAAGAGNTRIDVTAIGYKI